MSVARRGEVDMLDVLVCSHPPHTVRPRWLGGSLVSHGLFLLLAIAVTRAEV
jgi:hypothetical protein